MRACVFIHTYASYYVFLSNSIFRRVVLIYKCQIRMRDMRRQRRRRRDYTSISFCCCCCCWFQSAITTPFHICTTFFPHWPHKILQHTLIHMYNMFVFFYQLIISLTCDVMKSDCCVKEKYAKHQTSLCLCVCLIHGAAAFLSIFFTSKKCCWRCCFRFKIWFVL